MTKQQKSREILASLLHYNLIDVHNIKKNCELVSLVDIRKIYKAFGLTPNGRDKEMLIGTLRSLLYDDIQEKIETILGNDYK